ncbi:hypothetical protein GCM10028813_37110 [Ramlibacter alkalitolerans]
MFLACLCAGPALAQAVVREADGLPRPLHTYRSTTQHALIACGSPFAPQRPPVTPARAIGQYRACVVQAYSVVSPQFEAALRSLDDGSCVAALREYHGAFEKALTGMEPAPGESPFAYEQRQAFLFHAMAHAWGRFEIAESLVQ